MTPQSPHSEAFASETAERCGNVLLVDDNAADRMLLKAMLEQLGYHIWEAEELLTRKHFDMVLSDWMMPEMSGLELCERISLANVSPHYQVVA